MIFPKSDKIYTDLKFFEKNFKGVMPLEIIVDTKKKVWRYQEFLPTWKRLTLFPDIYRSMPDIARPLSITEGLKFAKQALFEGDSSNYSMPTASDLPALKEYLEIRNRIRLGSQNSFTNWCLALWIVPNNRPESA